MTDQIAEGREAWQSISKATTFENWKSVAIALSIGRQHALRLARVNHPHGTRYSTALNSWLDQEGFGGMAFGLRAKCLKLVDNLDEITLWRSSISEAERATQNHPEVVLRAWRKSKRATHVQAEVITHAHDKLTDRNRAGHFEYTKTTKIFWPQSAIKAAATAMRESRSSDWHKLARIALESAVPDAPALLELLPDPPKPTTRSAKPMPAAMSLSM